MLMESTPKATRRTFFRRSWIAAIAAIGGASARSSDLPQGDEPRKPALEPIPPEELEALRAQVVEAHNTIRSEAKLRKFIVSKKLTAAAQAHAEDMAAQRKMGHDGSDGSTPAERVKAQGYRYYRAGENVAAGRFSIDRLMRGWMNSPPHKKNILGGFSEIGVGCAVDEAGKRYWCVNFGLPSGH